MDMTIKKIVVPSDLLRFTKSSVIRQKDESQNGVNQKAKHAKFSEKRLFLNP